jgi:magnesium transporter
MQGDRNKILVDSIKRLLRRGATSHLLNIVNKTHAADLSVVFPSLSLSDQHRLFEMIKDTEQKGVLFSELEEDIFLNFSELEEDIFLNFVEGMEIDEIVEILESMPTDDVADLIGRLPDEMSDTILEKMKKEGSEEVEGLLRYDDDTAGGIMVPDFIALKEDTTAKEAIESLQKEHQDVEMAFYLYVVDEYGKLTGVSSLRQLVVVPPETMLKDFMATDVFSVQTDMDQEEVAKIVARYDILAVPVVDETNRLVGIVTVDDVIDIFRQEATEDILKMAGVGEEFVETKSVLKSTRIRLPWLFASCIGGMIAFFIISHFEESLIRYAYLAAFIPVIMGMGGNIGTQSSTIVVRGLATGRINTRDIWTVVLKELTVGCILGLVYGFLIAAVAQIQYGTAAFAISVGLAVISSMAVAALVGSLVPMAFAKINIDPAVATGPFVTTAIDVISVSFYFIIATALLGI